jgi:anaerobic selenocysteine-containing dehydrogenase
VKPDDALGGRGWDNYSWHTDLPPGHPMVTGQQTVEFDLHAVEHARMVIVWGMNWVTTKMPDTHWLTEARLKGTKVVVIACEYSSTSVKADDAIVVRPGTTPALALGLCNVIMREKLYDADYVRRFTDLPLLVRADTLKLLRAEEVFGAKPAQSVSYCLASAELAPEELDAVVISVQGRASDTFQRLDQNPIFAALPKSRLFTLPHHYAHALSAYCTAGVEDAAILVVDGVGSPMEDLLPEERRVLLKPPPDGWETVSMYAAHAEHLTAAHITGDIPIAVAGLETEKEFTRVMLDNQLELDVEQARAEHRSVARRLLATHPDIGALVLECTNMPPYAVDIQRETGLPVFDIVSLVTMVHGALVASLGPRPA